MNDVGFNIIDPDVTGVAFPIGLHSHTAHMVIQAETWKGCRILISEWISTKKNVRCSDDSSLQSSY